MAEECMFAPPQGHKLLGVGLHHVGAEYDGKLFLQLGKVCDLVELEHTLVDLQHADQRGTAPDALRVLGKIVCEIGYAGVPPLGKERFDCLLYTSDAADE